MDGGHVVVVAALDQSDGVGGQEAVLFADRALRLDHRVDAVETVTRLEPLVALKIGSDPNVLLHVLVYAY